MRNLRIAFSKRPGVLAWLTRVVTRAAVNHTLFLVEEGDSELVIDADWNGMVVRTRERWDKLGCVVVAEFPARLETGTDANIPRLLRMLDTPYDYGGLVGMLVVSVGRWLHRQWRNPFAAPGALFCSEAAVVLLQAGNYPEAWALDASATDPGTLLAWFRAGEARCTPCH